MSLGRLQGGSELRCGSSHSFPRFWMGRVVSGAYSRGRGNFYVLQMNSDSVNSFPSPHSIRKVPFTESIPLLLLLVVVVVVVVVVVLVLCIFFF